MKPPGGPPGAPPGQHFSLASGPPPRGTLGGTWGGLPGGQNFPFWGPPPGARGQVGDPQSPKNPPGEPRLLSRRSFPLSWARGPFGGPPKNPLFLEGVGAPRGNLRHRGLGGPRGEREGGPPGGPFLMVEVGGGLTPSFRALPPGENPPWGEEGRAPSPDGRRHPRLTEKGGGPWPQGVLIPPKRGGPKGGLGGFSRAILGKKNPGVEEGTRGAPCPQEAAGPPPFWEKRGNPPPPPPEIILAGGAQKGPPRNPLGAFSRGAGEKGPPI